eukprot:205603-Rhodomonas_salina.1
MAAALRALRPRAQVGLFSRGSDRVSRGLHRVWKVAKGLEVVGAGVLGFRANWVCTGVVRCVMWSMRFGAWRSWGVGS